MNAFYLAEDLAESASYHVDSHCIKIILEAAQCLSTAKWELGEEAHYKATHKNHPTCVWTRTSLDNYNWMANYGLALCKEYTFRYGKIHKTQPVLQDLINNPPKNIPDIGKTKFYLAMPDSCKINDDPVLSYRNYYNKEKKHLFKWKKREVPNWVLK